MDTAIEMMEHTRNAAKSITAEFLKSADTDSRKVTKLYNVAVMGRVRLANAPAEVAMRYAENLVNRGVAYVQIVEPDGTIYCEYET
jgi:hypothetical protein